MSDGHDSAPPRPVVTAALASACAIWFLVWLALGERMGVRPSVYLAQPPIRLLGDAGGVNGASLVLGQWWRLGSNLFVHAGLLHLAFNLYSMVAVGPAVEDVWGRKRTLAVYVVGGLAGACLAVGLRPMAVLVGASGAVWGLLAAVAVWLRLHRDQLDPADARFVGRRLWLSAALGVAVSLLPGVSWEGHLGGAVGGGLTAWILNRPRWYRWLLTLLLAAGCVGGLFAAVVYAPNWRLLCRQVAAVTVVPIHPGRANELAQNGLAASISGVSPKGLTDRAAKLSADARAASNGWVPATELIRARAYARAVAELADAVAAGTADPAELKAKQRAVREAWAALGG